MTFYKKKSKDFIREKAPTVENMPLCERCMREGGITLYGRHYAAQRAHVHPLHEWADRDKDGNPIKVHRRGPMEALCSYHIELCAWETRKREQGGESTYPEPAWTKPLTPSQQIASDRVNALFNAPPPPRTKEPTRISDLFPPREPGDESDDEG